MTDTAADITAVKMLTMRSWRRGMREMDLLLGPFAEAALPAMTEGQRAEYAALLEENDQDLYAWVIAASNGGVAAPAAHADLIAEIAAAAAARLPKR